MKHPLTVNKYQGTLQELAKDVSNLNYDSLDQFIKWLGYYLYEDSEKDKMAGRVKLGENLRDASDLITASRLPIIHAWKICKKFEENENEHE